MSLRGRAIAYLVVLHLHLRGTGRLPVPRQPLLAARHRSGLRRVAGRRAAAVARDVPPARPGRRGSAADPRRGVHVAIPAGRPAGDRRADRRLQPDGRSPARRAGAARRAAPVPQPGAPGLALGRRDPGLRRRDQQPQPGGRTPARPDRGGRGRPAARGPGLAARRCARGARSRRGAAGRAARGATREVPSRHLRRSRVPAQLPAGRGADRGAAPVRARRLRKADPGDVARGEQHRRRLELAAALVARPTPAISTPPTGSTSSRRSASSSSGPSS